MVELREGPGGQPDFVVHGWIDIDDDDEIAHYTATKSIEATQVTPNSHY